jgi:hypothetical protein
MQSRFRTLRICHPPDGVGFSILLFGFLRHSLRRLPGVHDNMQLRELPGGFRVVRLCGVLTSSAGSPAIC